MTALRAVTRSLQGWHLDPALCTRLAASVPHTALGSRVTSSRSADRQSFFTCHSLHTDQYSAQRAHSAHHSRLQPPAIQLHANSCELTSPALARASLMRTFSSRLGGPTLPPADDEQQANDASTAATESTPMRSSPDSGNTRSTETESPVDTEAVFVYHGPLSHTLLRLKVGALSDRLDRQLSTDPDCVRITVQSVRL